ncbi:hypothetical protein ACFL54_07230 [Planctomycetota bacterium]
MLKTFKIIGILLALLIVPAAVHAAYIKIKKDKKILVGSVVEVTDEIVRFKEIESGAIFEFQFNEITPRSLFKILRNRIDDSDEAKLLELADFGLAEKLLVLTGELIEGVIKLRGELQEEAFKKLDQLRLLEAQSKMDKAAKQLDREEFDAARKTCHAIMIDYSETPFAAKARMFIDDIIEEERLFGIKKEKEANEQITAEEQVKEEKERLRLEGWLDIVKEKLREAKKFRNAGLEGESKGQWTVAIKSFQNAEKLYGDVLIILERYFLSVKFQRIDFIKRAQGAKSVTMKNLLRCFTEHCSTYISVPNWKMALRTIKKALLIDPEDETALELVKIIQENAIFISLKNTSGRGIK